MLNIKKQLREILAELFLKRALGKMVNHCNLLKFDRKDLAW